MRVESFEDLIVWQRAVDFAVEVYRLSSRFPEEERFALTTQVRKAAVSVSANIAEGSGRETSPDLLNFLSYSRGSLKETQSHLLVAQRLDYLNADQCMTAFGFSEEVSKMLSSLRRSIRSNPRNTRR